MYSSKMVGVDKLTKGLSAREKLISPEDKIGSLIFQAQNEKCPNSKCPRAKMKGFTSVQDPNISIPLTFYSCNRSNPHKSVID